jgi:hypothetical protein
MVNPELPRESLSRPQQSRHTCTQRRSLREGRRSRGKWGTRQGVWSGLPPWSLPRCPVAEGFPPLPPEVLISVKRDLIYAKETYKRDLLLLAYLRFGRIQRLNVVHRH